MQSLQLFLSGILCADAAAASLFPRFPLFGYGDRGNQDVKLPSSRTKLSIAKTMSSSLKDGVLYQSHSASERNETALLRILTPSQTARFQRWIVANRTRCNRAFGGNTNRTSEPVTEVENGDGVPCSDGGAGHVGLDAGTGGSFSGDPSLSNVCERLTEALKIGREEGEG